MNKNEVNGTSILPYNGQNITFELANGDVMVNLTEMGKAFNKRPIDFLRLPSTNQLVSAIVRKSHISENQVVIQKSGSPQSGGGTWANRLVALSYAQWLSVDFHLICLEKIEEILTTGVATVNNDDATIAQAMEILNKRLEQAKAEKERLQLENKEQQAQIQANAPRVRFSQAVETSDRSILIGELAKILKQNGVEIGERRLFKWLRENGYLCSHGERYNQPTQRAMEMELFELKKTTINKPDGTTLVSTTTKVTGKGQIYFVDKFLRQVA